MRIGYSKAESRKRKAEFTYPLSAFRAMSAAALQVFRAIRSQGTQKKMVTAMQSRARLYHFLGYDPRAR